MYDTNGLPQLSSGCTIRMACLSYLVDVRYVCGGVWKDPVSHAALRRIPPVLPASVSVRCSARACNVLAQGPDLSCRVLFPPLCVYVFYAGLSLTRRRVFK